MTTLRELRDALDFENTTSERQQDVANYIASIAFELRQMTISAGLPEITAPLEQVYYQAWQMTERLAEPKQSRVNEPAASVR